MTRFSLVLSAALLVLGTPAAFAKAKKKSAPASAPAQDTEQPGDGNSASEKPAAQANDEEKPKAMLDLGQEAPKQDSLGHVHFASPNGEGLGRVTINAPAGDKVKVFLEGRLFGTAPVTVYSVPKGDYIIEALYPNGKQISKPVTVSENEETTVDLNPKAASKDQGGSTYSGGEMTSTRKTLMWSFIVGAGVGLAVGATFGILELQAENDYQHTPSDQQSQLDSIQQRGQRDANIADVGWVVAAVGAVGAAVCAWPMIFGGGGEKGSAAPAGTSSAMVVAPVAGHGMTGGTLMFRF